MHSREPLFCSRAGVSADFEVVWFVETLPDASAKWPLIPEVLHQTCSSAAVPAWWVQLWYSSVASDRDFWAQHDALVDVHINLHRQGVVGRLHLPCGLLAMLPYRRQSGGVMARKLCHQEIYVFSLHRNRFLPAQRRVAMTVAWQRRAYNAGACSTLLSAWRFSSFHMVLLVFLLGFMLAFLFSIGMSLAPEKNPSD